MRNDQIIYREGHKDKPLYRILLNKALLFLAMLPIGSSIRKLLLRLTGINIGKDVFIASYVLMDDQYPEFISIENNVTISYRTTILTHDDSKGVISAVTIKRKAWIGACSTILPGVEIGEYAVVGAGATVNKNVPPKATIVGAKTRIIYNEIIINTI